MMRKPPKYVHGFKDRHGKPRWYLRRRGFKRVPLPGLPWSPEFMAVYEAAMADQPREPIGAGRTKPGTISALVVAYYESPGFKNLEPSTQYDYRNILDNFRNDHGEKRVAMLERRHIEKMIVDRIATPSAANKLLKMLRLLMGFAMRLGMRRDDPTAGVKRLKITSPGHPVWSHDDIAKYRDRHQPGTKARLAMELGLNTMQRRSDLVRMGPQHIRSGTLSIRQVKTGMLVEIPVLPELKAALEASPSDHLTFVVTEAGKPFSTAGFGNWFRDRCTEAGLPTGFNTHGLRKAGATRLADAGCSDHEIMAWGGWKTLSEVQRYTRAANRKRLAAGAVLKLESGRPQDH